MTCHPVPIETLTPTLSTARLTLRPLHPIDANAMVFVLANPLMYEFTGGRPPSLEDLHAQYTRQAAGSGGEDETWHNWILRPLHLDQPIGLVQATVGPEEAAVAWLIGVPWQGRGYATEAAAAACQWLEANGTGRLTAYIHPRHHVSQRVATALGLTDSGTVDEDGEGLWQKETRRIGQY